MFIHHMFLLSNLVTTQLVIPATVLYHDGAKVTRKSRHIKPLCVDCSGRWSRSGHLASSSFIIFPVAPCDARDGVGTRDRRRWTEAKRVKSVDRFVSSFVPESDLSRVGRNSRTEKNPKLKGLKSWGSENARL